MTDYIQWTPDMSVGVPVLDKDHQQLVGLLNEFIKAVDDGEGVLAVDSIFSGLMTYTETHFVREEKVMEACGYADLEAHREQHKKLAERVCECREAYMRTITESLEGEVRDFLMSWLQDHILVDDMDYKALAEENPKAVDEALGQQAYAIN